MKKAAEKDPLWARLFFAAVMLLNIILTAALRISGRKEIIKVIQDEENKDIIRIDKKD